MAESVTASQLRFVPKARRKASASAGVRSQRYKPGSSPVTRCTISTRCKRGGNGQASKGGVKVRGSVVSKMARKVSREMLLTPSKSTALRRWRINWPAEWRQAGGDGGGHAINSPDSGCFAFAAFRSEAVMASSITGHSTCKWLNRLACPNHSMAVPAAGDRVVRSEEGRVGEEGRS